MDVILDESSLLPCNSWSPAERIEKLAATLDALDKLGCARHLRTVRAAPDQDIGSGLGLRTWCFDRGTKADAGRFVAVRLGRQPFIDGDGGLFAEAEGARAIEGRANNVVVIGLTLAALTEAPAIALGSAAIPNSTEAEVNISGVDDGGEFSETIQVVRVVSNDDVGTKSAELSERLLRSVRDGEDLLERANDLFPRLRFGPGAINQIGILTGKESVFPQLLRHLRALDRGALNWAAGHDFSPAEAISWSPESAATLQHRRYGPLRDFPMPDGFSALRWSTHSKLSGGNGARLYFDARKVNDRAIVLIGYFGEHLATVKFD